MARQRISKAWSPVTIKQVATEARVSRATVSRAYSHPHLLSRSTVEHVVAVAKRLGYVPNQTARALSTGRAGNIALILPDITNPFFAAFMRGAQARARDEGYATFLGDSDETPELEHLLLNKLAAQVEGFILVSSRLAKAQILQHGARRPLVLVNRDIPRLSRLLVDTGPSYAAGVEHLAALGHRVVAYVAGPSLSWSDRERGQAVQRTAEPLGLRIVRIATSRPTHEAGLACTEELLKSGTTAALTFDDVIAQGIMAGLASRGLSVPADFSLIGCDGILATTTYPPLTSVTIRCAEAGMQATDLLLERLRGAASRERCISLPTELVLRATTAPPPPRTPFQLRAPEGEIARTRAQRKAEAKSVPAASLQGRSHDQGPNRAE
jgi:LacI family transcriptional regulator